MNKSYRMLAAIAAVALVSGACSSSNGGSGGSGGRNSAQGAPPTAKMKPQTSIGAGEGQLNLIAWEGYAEPQWVKPFEQATGCQVNAKYGGSSDEMVTLMRNG